MTTVVAIGEYGFLRFSKLGGIIDYFIKYSELTNKMRVFSEGRCTVINRVNVCKIQVPFDSVEYNSMWLSLKYIYTLNLDIKKPGYNKTWI